MVSPRATTSSWSIIGHASQVERLRRMVTAGQYPLAILVTGTPGVGRKALALQFAAASLCQNGHEGVPCTQCRTCGLVAAGRHPDAEIWSVKRQEEESGTASKSGTLTIETVRKIAASTALRPYEGKRRFIIIDEAETLGDPAQQALLKTLEDLPGYATIILISTTAGAMLDTVQSRCVEIALQLVPTVEIAAGVDAPDVGTVAAMAAGRPGWAMRAISEPEWRASQAEEVERIEAWLKMSRADRLGEAYQRGDRFVKDRRAAFQELDRVQLIWRDILLASSDLDQFAFDAVRARSLISRSSADISEWHRALSATRQCIQDLTGNIRPRLAMQAMVNQWPIL
jgi:DNA polymerase III subunit delta'